MGNITLTTKDGVKFVPKESSAFMKFINAIVPTKDFMTRFWTTIGTTVYYPSSCAAPFKPQYYKGVIRHEMAHVEQFRKYGMVLMTIAYLFFPLPVLFSGRWWVERGPYLEDIRRGRIYLDSAVDSLWTNYFYPWPKSWMKRWFEERLDD